MLDLTELIESIEQALPMWNLVHLEHHEVDLASPQAGYDGEAWRRLKKNLEELKQLETLGCKPH